MTLKMRTLAPVTLILLALGIDLYQPARPNQGGTMAGSDTTSFYWFVFSLACNGLVL